MSDKGGLDNSLSLERRLSVDTRWGDGETMFDSMLQRKSRLMNAAERNFFDLVIEALGDEHFVFTKVRVLDVVETTPATTWMKAKKLKKTLSDQFFDYVICRQDDTSIFGIIQLEKFEEKSGKKSDHHREELISQVCKDAKLKLFYFDIRQNYKGIDLRRLITGKATKKDEINSPTHQSQLTIDGASVTELSRMRSCPKCHAEVVTKVAVKGDRIGEKFLMCRKYPYCDYQVPLSDAKLQKSHSKKVESDAKPGFKNWSAS